MPLYIGESEYRRERGPEKIGAALLGLKENKVSRLRGGGFGRGGKKGKSLRFGKIQWEAKDRLSRRT